MQSGSAVSRSEVNAPVDEKLSQFHRELTETCTDVMARYTFANFSALPHRFETPFILISKPSYEMTRDILCLVCLFVILQDSKGDLDGKHYLDTVWTCVSLDDTSQAMVFDKAML